MAMSLRVQIDGRSREGTGDSEDEAVVSCRFVDRNDMSAISCVFCGFIVQDVSCRDTISQNFSLMEESTFGWSSHGLAGVFFFSSFSNLINFSYSLCLSAGRLLLISYW